MPSNVLLRQFGTLFSTNLSWPFRHGIAHVVWDDRWCFDVRCVRRFTLVSNFILYVYYSNRASMICAWKFWHHLWKLLKKRSVDNRKRSTMAPSMIDYLILLASSNIQVNSNGGLYTNGKAFSLEKKARFEFGLTHGPIAFAFPFLNCSYTRTLGSYSFWLGKYWYNCIVGSNGRTSW